MDIQIYTPPAESSSREENVQQLLKSFRVGAERQTDAARAQVEQLAVENAELGQEATEFLTQMMETMAFMPMLIEERLRRRAEQLFTPPAKVTHDIIEAEFEEVNDDEQR